MKRILVMVCLLLSLFAYKVSAAPNTGRLPENGVKVNFNGNGTVSSMEGNGWSIESSSSSLTLTKGEVVITLNEYVFKDGSEIIGFSWMIEGATAVLWVKHGTSSLEYGDGTSGSFTTGDRKGVSNAVFLVEIVDDEDEIVEEEDDNDDESDEELEDESDDEEEEEIVEEEDDNEDEVLGEEVENEEEVEEELEEETDEENDEVISEEDEVLSDEEESMPDTSDRNSGLLSYGALLLGLLLWSVSKKKEVRE